MKRIKIVSLFAGCGGLDLGFEQAGFDIIWANEYDKSIWETYKFNHSKSILDERSITDIKTDEIPECDGIIGGPPCQSWSLAGAMRGENDPRGKLFYEYKRLIIEKQPLFFLAENVSGILSSTHIKSFLNIIDMFEDLGYHVNYKLLNAKNYGVPQERKRVFIVGYSQKIGKTFSFPQIINDDINNTQKNILNNVLPIVTLENVIGNMSEAKPATEKNKANNPQNLDLPNHEYMNGSFSTIYMSRNRKKEWDQPSFTIQAGGRHAPLHPKAKKMIKLEKDLWKFDEDDKDKYRRLSVRECARIQTFPDDFIFKYNSIADGYKMIGNAVPVKLAKVIADKIKEDLKSV